MPSGLPRRVEHLGVREPQQQLLAPEASAVKDVEKEGSTEAQQTTQLESSGRRCANFGKISAGGVRQSSLVLISTAVGGGVLSVSYVMYLCGLGLGSIILLIGAYLAYTSSVALMDMAIETGIDSYAGLFSHCAGSWGGPVLDAMIFIYGNGACVGYFVFLGDFIPALLSLMGGPAWLASRPLAIACGGLLVAWPCLQKDVGLLRMMTPLSIIALAYVTLVVAVQMPWRYTPVDKRPDHHNMPWFNFNSHLPEAFAICVFAFNCHTNVVPVVSDLVRPTRERRRKISFGTNLIQASFYLVMAVCGHLSFVTDTPQDILADYDRHDGYMIVARGFLTCALLVTLPMNSIPAMVSGLRLIRCATKQEETSEAPKAWPRLLLAGVCLILQAALAVQVPGVADVLSLLGGTVATGFIMIIPAFCMWKLLPRTRSNLAKQVLLICFSMLSFVSVPIKILRMAGVIVDASEYPR